MRRFDSRFYKCFIAAAWVWGCGTSDEGGVGGAAASGGAGATVSPGQGGAGAGGASVGGTTGGDSGELATGGGGPTSSNDGGGGTYTGDGAADAARPDVAPPPSDAGADPPITSEPALRWIGRTETIANGARFDWPGTGFVARFNGTSAKVQLTTTLFSAPSDYYEVVVDDGAPTLLTTASGKHDYDLATGLTSGIHTVTLWRRTEPLGSSVDVGPVTFGNGALLAPPAPSSKRVEVVGDSISVGYGVECKSQSEGFTYATENNYQTYQSIVARALGADLVTLAWSGIGMYRDVGGATTASGTPQMPVRYLRAVAHEDASTWDFSKLTPGAVVVHLGTNDFAQGDPGQPFVQAYVDFVKNVRTRYPKARIYCAVSPMVEGANRTTLHGYLSQVVTTRATSGDMNIAVIEFMPPASNAWGCGHPNGATHAIMADVLKQALQTDLGW